VSEKKPIRIVAALARENFLKALRQHNYTGKTTEISEWSGMHTSIVRRAGLALANANMIEAVLVPGRGKGEYRFTITQLDLFEDIKPIPETRGRFPSLKELMDRLVEVKARLWTLNLISKFRRI